MSRLVVFSNFLPLHAITPGLLGSIETLDQRQCDLLQGVYFARPMPREAAMQLPDRLPASA